ncbi:TldD/PmbA family protein [Pseudenhygromyxa sp. WMMC2535]|nr:TldD/PmbA family protein [Pseudenhygromyxa sp. WMMC2535]
MRRRHFLQGATAGAAILTAPSFLIGCDKGRGGASSSVSPGLEGGAPPPSAALFSEWFGLDEVAIRRAMSALSERGADHADIYLQHSRSNAVTFEDGVVASANTSITQGVGLRVVIGEQVGYAYTEELTPEALVRTAKSAAAIAKGSAVAGPQHFSPVERPSYYELAVPWSEVGVDRKLPLIRETAALAVASDPAVDKVSVRWNDGEERILIATLDGRLIADERPMTRLWLNLSAKRGGEVQSNGSNLAGRQGIDWYTRARIEQLVGEARDRTMVLFDARRPPAGEMPVVLAAGASGILLHEAIGHGMEADFNRKEISIYADMLGQKIAPDFVTIVDDGTIDNERGSLNVDDEGNLCQRTTLVEDGVLVSYLHDHISAKHYDVAPTGSGRRESYRFPPLPRMRSTFMEDGPHSREEIIASVDHGIIAETFTNGQVQIGAGDFTFYIKNGWLIEGGKITAPIKDTNIIGNGPEALRKVTMAANDSKLDTGGWTCGKDGQGVPVSQGLPTVLVSGMNVGGENNG